MQNWSRRVTIVCHCVAASAVVGFLPVWAQTARTADNSEENQPATVRPGKVSSAEKPPPVTAPKNPIVDKIPQRWVV